MRYNHNIPVRMLIKPTVPYIYHIDDNDNNEFGDFFLKLRMSTGRGQPHVNNIIYNWLLYTGLPTITRHHIIPQTPRHLHTRGYGTLQPYSID